VIRVEVAEVIAVGAAKVITTHNRFYRTTDERDDALRSTFGTFQATPSLIANHVARFL
jgi:hypothetical protein